MYGIFRLFLIPSNPNPPNPAPNPRDGRDWPSGMFLRRSLVSMSKVLISSEAGFFCSITFKRAFNTGRYWSFCCRVIPFGEIGKVPIKAKFNSYLKVSKFQNVSLMSSFLPKYEPNIVRISNLYYAALQDWNPYNFWFVFWEKQRLHKFILKFTDLQIVNFFFIATWYNRIMLISKWQTILLWFQLN